MSRIIQRGLVFLAFVVPLVFSHGTTEVYGLIKWTVLELGILALLILWLRGLMNTLSFRDRDSPLPGDESLVKVGPLGWPVLSFFTVALLSLIKASNKYEGILSIYQLGAGIGLFFLVVNNVKEKKEVNQIVLAMVLSGLIACLFSLYENRGIRLSVSRLAYTSTFGNPIFFAQYLSLVIPLSVAMCLGTVPFRNSPFSRVFFGLSALFMLVFVILTRSRGAYLGLFVAFLYCYVVLLSHSSKRLRKILIGLLVICLFALALGLRSSVGESKRLRNLMRVYLWSSTFEMVKDYPVLGVGTGNFKVIYPLYRSPQEREVTPKGVTYSKAHNDYLQIWVETGTLGLVCFLWILFCLFVYVLPGRDGPFRGQSLKTAGPSRHISLGLSAALIALLFQALFNPLLYVPASMMGFWMLLGLIALNRVGA